jgi:hypothetical protein
LFGMIPRSLRKLMKFIFYTILIENVLDAAGVSFHHFIC